MAEASEFLDAVRDQMVGATVQSVEALPDGGVKLWLSGCDTETGTSWAGFKGVRGLSEGEYVLQLVVPVEASKAITELRPRREDPHG